MLWFIIAIVVLAIMLRRAIKIVDANDDPYDDLVFVTFMIFGIGGMAAAFLLNSMCGLVVDQPFKYDRTYKLYNLADSMSVSGRFFLGSGTIDSNPVFSYYTDGHGGGYVLAHKDASNSRIFTNENPRLEVWKSKSSNIWLTVFNHDEENRFFVPNGSIKPVYNLDAQ